LNICYQFLNSLQEAQEEIEKVPNYYDETEVTINKLAKRVLPSLLKKYDDLSSIDSVAAAQSKANEVQSIMGNNIRGMMDNMQNLEVRVKYEEKLRILNRSWRKNPLICKVKLKCFQAIRPNLPELCTLELSK